MMHLLSYSSVDQKSVTSFSKFKSAASFLQALRENRFFVAAQSLHSWFLALFLHLQKPVTSNSFIFLWSNLPMSRGRKVVCFPNSCNYVEPCQMIQDELPYSRFLTLDTFPKSLSSLRGNIHKIIGIIASTSWCREHSPFLSPN